MNKTDAHEIAALPEQKFVDRYGCVYEDSPWVAKEFWQQFNDILPMDTAALATRMKSIVDDAGRERQLELIRNHPDLAGRAAQEGTVTAASREEQNSAGLDNCSAAELAEFNALNDRYKNRFEFPFIMAVRGADRLQILAAFRERLNHDYRSEFACALDEIHKIAQLRLEAMQGE